MPTKNQDFNFPKPDWRRRNFSFARKFLAPVRQPFAILETFGGPEDSGPVSKQAAIDSGLILGEEYFYGVDVSPKIVLNHYDSGQDGLYYGDIFRLAKRLAPMKDMPPIGVFNFDLCGLAGETRFWHQDGVEQLVREAVYASLDRIGRCVVILNQGAETPGARHSVADVVRKQHERAASHFGDLGPIQAPQNYHSVDAIDLRNLEKGEFRRLSENYEVYRSKTLLMLTLRFTVMRKDHS